MRISGRGTRWTLTTKVSTVDVSSSAAVILNFIWLVRVSIGFLVIEASFHGPESGLNHNASGLIFTKSFLALLE